MKVVSRRISCALHKTNYLALLHLLANSHANSRALGIKRFQSIAVVDFDVIAIAASPWINAIGNNYTKGSL